MHPRLSEVLSALDASHEQLRHAVEGVPRRLREQRPAPGRWSVAEVLEHLYIVDGRIAGLIAAEIEKARAAGLGLELETGPVPPIPDLSKVVDRRFPRAASEASQPREGLDASSAWHRLDERRLDLRAAVLTGDGLALGAVTAPHAAVGVLNLYQWVLFAAGHELRHAEQIREIGAALSSAV